MIVSGSVLHDRWHYKAFRRWNSPLLSAHFNCPVNAMFEDSSHRYWFGCYWDRAVAMYDRPSGDWKVFGDHRPLDDPGLQYWNVAVLPGSVCGIAESKDGRVWFASDFANSRKGPSNPAPRSGPDDFTYFQEGRWASGSAPMADNGELESCGMFRGIDGRLWFWRDGELTSYDGQACSRPIRLRDVLGDVRGGWAIGGGLEDAAARLWLETRDGLVMSDADHRAWIKRVDVDRLVGLIGPTMHQDRRGRLWFVRPMSAVVYEPTLGTATRYAPPESLPGMEDKATRINALYQDREGRLLFGLDSGLVSFTPDNGKWEFFDLWPFEIGNNVGVIMEDDAGRIWVTALLGVLVLEP
jgi:hypothetical protein